MSTQAYPEAFSAAARSAPILKERSSASASVSPGRFDGNDVYLRVQEAIQQQIGAQVLGPGRNDGGEVEYRMQPQAAAGGRGLHGMVGLRRAIGDRVRRAVGDRFPQQEFQLAHLVSAEEIDAGKVIPLHIQADAQQL